MTDNFRNRLLDFLVVLVKSKLALASILIMAFSIKVSSQNATVYDYTQNGKKGLRNKDSVITTPKYDSIFCYIPNNTWATYVGYKLGFVNSTGKEILPNVYDSVTAIWNELKEVTVVKDRKYGLYSIDSSKEIVPPIYDNIMDNIENEVMTFQDKGKQGLFYYYSGKVAIKPIFDSIADVVVFNFATVMNKKKFGLYDFKKQSLVLQCVYKSIKWDGTFLNVITANNIEKMYHIERGKLVELDKSKMEFASPRE